MTHTIDANSATGFDEYACVGHSNLRKGCVLIALNTRNAETQELVNSTVLSFTAEQARKLANAILASARYAKRLEAAHPDNNWF